MDRIKMYIDGEWISSSSGNSRKIINPADGELVYEAEEGTADEAKAAAAAAKRAFSPGSAWRKLTAAQRAALLNRAADLIEERAEELAIAETKCIGRIYNETRYDDIYAACGSLRYYAGIVNELQGKTTLRSEKMLSMTIREPIGVCAIIAPWNYTLGTTVAGIAPALAAGNTVVVKPSSLTPVSAALLFQILEDAGFPAGSVNLVLGPGEEIGSALAESKDVDKIIFTGGTETGKDIVQKSHKSLKRYSLELGGKSAFILFNDANLDAAVDNLLFGIFLSQGQVCTAGSRLLVQDTIYDQTLELLKKRTEQIKIGMPFDQKAEFGPMASKAQMQRVLKYIEIGKSEGAELLIGGKRIEHEPFKNGYFVEPTIFVECAQNMRIVQEEIFGPILTVQKFSSEEEAIQLANDTQYGLAGGVFTSDLGRALRVCEGINTGILWVNSYMEGSSGMSISPHKQSGIGTVGGLEGLQEFTVLKQINLKINPTRMGWFKGETEEE